MIFYLSFYHYLDICVIWSLETDNQSMASVFIQIVLLLVHLYHLCSYELHSFVRSCSLIEVTFSFRMLEKYLLTVVDKVDLVILALCSAFIVSS
jgi:hypothetical protein